MGGGRYRQNETIRPGKGSREAGFINSKGLEEGRGIVKGSQIHHGKVPFCA